MSYYSSIGIAHQSHESQQNGPRPYPGSSASYASPENWNFSSSMWVRSVSSSQSGNDSFASEARARVDVACDRCRRRKIKCSGQTDSESGCKGCKVAGYGPGQCVFRRNGSMHIDAAQARSRISTASMPQYHPQQTLHTRPADNLHSPSSGRDRFLPSPSNWTSTREQSGCFFPPSAFHRHSTNDCGSSQCAQCLPALQNPPNKVYRRLPTPMPSAVGAPTSRIHMR